MNPPIKNRFLTLVLLFTLALVATSSLAFAFTAQETAQFFARQGETATVVPFGSGYQMVLINGVEMAVLKQSGNEFIIVEDQGEINTAVGKYSAKAFGDLKPLVPQINNSFSVVRNSIDACIIGSKWFSFNETKVGVYAKFNVRNDPAHYPAEYGAIWFINNSIGDFEAGWNKAKSAIDSLPNALNSQDQALAAAADARDGLKPVLAQYDGFYQAYLNATGSNQFAYKFNGIDHPCDSTDNITGQINAVLNLISPHEFTPSSVVLNDIQVGMQARLADAKQNELKTGASVQAGSLADQATQIKANFSAYGVDLKALQADITALQNAVGTQAFANQSQSLAQKLVAYEQDYADFNNLQTALVQADAALKNATTRYGANDDRITSMQTQLQQIRVSLKDGESALSAGNLTAVNFTSLGQQASTIASNAANLQPKENQFDFVTIGGIALLIAVAAGGYWYFRKRQQPPLGSIPQ